ncbi:MAG: ABC transporter ATP-binding protein/permease [Oscillospiraceae bacterium]|nr:ABC transporter ATP-binding protein/permease [Oscillospiraceae bacterium]
MSEERKKYPFLKTVLRTIPIQFRAALWPTIANISMSVIHALTWTAVVIATQILFDAISRAAIGQIGFADCAIPLLILAGATFGQQIINGVHNFLWSIVEGKSAVHIKTLLYKKLQRINPADFENTAFLDDVNKAKEGTNSVSQYCTTFLNIGFFYGIYFASVGAYLFSLKPILLITVMISFLPAMLAQIVRGKVFTKLEEQSAPLRREYEYYQKTLCDREYFKETRILGAFKFFHKLFSDTMALLTRKTWRAERKTALLQLLLNTTSFAGMAVSTYMLFTATMAGEITVGAFAAVFSALGMIFNIMREIVTMHLGGMNKDLGKVANYIRILDLPERTGADGTPDFTKGITAQNISFTYPGREEPAVRDVSLNIASGETVAIVGENGAGKSTLVRLLTGIYRPSEGRVTAGGLDTSETAPAGLYNGVSGVFQKYQRYKMTLEENVTISSVKATAPGRPCQNDMARVQTALREADFNDESISLDTMLSPEFDGIDLSGGQWQRLAIARGLYRTNGFIVLDEPTAAIDPIEETRVYTQFQRLAEGKCAVVVTHRLGSAKLAHRIVVMDAGKIVDTGTHDELLSRPGKYAGMWAAQAKWYERTENHAPLCFRG